MNPFTNRGVITESEGFFGRKREMEALLARTVGSLNPQSCAVVGPRRIGKSSLMYRGAHLEVAGPEGEALHRVYLDLQSSRAGTEDSFFALLRRRLARSLPGEIASHVDARGADGGPAAFEDLIEEISGSCRVVFLLDEFDRITGNPAFGPEVFSSLRYLANNFPVALVTSSVRDLRDLCHGDEIRESPFFNIFTTLPLGLFEESEAREMLVGLSERGGERYDEEEIRFLLDLAGTHPFFLQVAASALWEQRDSEGRAERVVARFLQEAEPHFQYLLDHLDDSQRRAVFALAQGEATPSDPTTGRLLRRQSVVVERGDDVELFSSGFRRFLQERGAQMGWAFASAGLATTRAQAAEGALPGAGDRVAGRYLLKEPIGHGGFGVVFRALDERLERIVAVKFLRADRNRELAAKWRRRFEREARTLAKMAHPNIIAVLDFGTHEDADFLVMEWFDGAPLGKAIEGSGAFPQAEACRIAADIAGALAHAHTRGVVHRDVSPANVLLSESGWVKVLDFGIARDQSVTRMTSRDALLFNPRYCAPERLRDDRMPVDGRADIFSLGCVLYELLIGGPLFDGETVPAVIAAILSGTVPSERIAASGLPSGIQGILTRCLASEPADRYGSCEDLADDLRRYA